MSASLADQLATTALSGANADFIEELYQRYLTDPKSIDSGWARYFATLQAGRAPEAPQRPMRERAGTAPRGETQRPPMERGGVERLERRPAPADTGAASAKQAAVSRLISVHSNRGHLIAHLDPLNLAPREKPSIFDPAF